MFYKRFRAEQWTEVFFAVSGENKTEAFLCLKALTEPFKSLRGVFFGRIASRQLEKILRECVKTCENSAVENVIRFICLLTEKNFLRYINSLIKRIEKKLDEQNGVITVSVEFAASKEAEASSEANASLKAETSKEVLASMDNDFEKELALHIKEKTGAADIKINTKINPQLLGGYLLRVNNCYIDASLKGQLEIMKAQLCEDACTAEHGSR